MPSNKTQKHKTTHNKTKKHMKVDDYVIAIPSYKRAHILKEKTLDLLKRQKIPKQKWKLRFLKNYCQTLTIKVLL